MMRSKAMTLIGFERGEKENGKEEKKEKVKR